MGRHIVIDCIVSLSARVFLLRAYITIWIRVHFKDNGKSTWYLCSSGEVIQVRVTWYICVIDVCFTSIY